MHNFRNLEIWKDAMDLAQIILEETKLFLAEEKFSLTSQLRRCAISVPSNIAEGSSRSSTKEFAHFLKISLGSCFEIETQIILAGRCGYISSDNSVKIIEKVVTLQKRITTFLKTIEAK